MRADSLSGGKIFSQSESAILFWEFQFTLWLLLLNRGAEADAKWLCELLNRLGARGELVSDLTITLHPFT
jgi:hypothetical protein